MIIQSSTKEKCHCGFSCSYYYSHFINNGRWTKNKINSFNYLSIKMSQLFGIRKVKDIVTDWKKLNINISDHWFGYHVSEKYKKYNLVNIESNIETNNITFLLFNKSSSVHTHIYKLKYQNQ